MAQEMGQVQGVTIPLVAQTPVEKMRVVKIQPGLYNTIRSFVDSSLKEGYPWRLAYEWKGEYEWRKEGRWVLRVFKQATVLNAKKLPVEGIYKVTDKVVQPTAVLTGKGELWFVVVNNEFGVYYDAAKLVFTSRAPIAYEPMMPVPFARPIPVYEIVDTLSYYVSF